MVVCTGAIDTVTLCMVRLFYPYLLTVPRFSKDWKLGIVTVIAHCVLEARGIIAMDASMA